MAWAYRCFPAPESGGLVENMLARDCANLLPEKFLMKADKATMAHGIEERLPLLADSVVRVAQELPASWKLRGGMDKFLFREAVADLLPPVITYRAKQGFNTPLGPWMMSPQLQPLVLHLVGLPLPKEIGGLSGLVEHLLRLYRLKFHSI